MTAGLEPGDRIGPYTVVGLLGAASPGWVHLARTDDAGRPVAARLMPDDSPRPSSGDVEDSEGSEGSEDSEGSGDSEDSGDSGDSEGSGDSGHSGVGARDAVDAGDTPVDPVASVRAAADETVQLDAVSTELVPRIDDVDDRYDGYDMSAPAPPAVGVGWLVVVLVVLVAAVGGVFAGVGYQRSRDDGRAVTATPGPSVAASPATQGPVALFAASLAVGACVDFATDGAPGWQPSAPRTLPCDDPAARQRVLARVAAEGGADDCMNTDGRSRWPVGPGAPTLCMERVFHEGECVPADERDGRQWAFLAYLTPCKGAGPEGRAARLRIDEVRFGPTRDKTACAEDSPVYYSLPSRGLELCMSTTK